MLEVEETTSGRTTVSYSNNFKDKKKDKSKRKSINLPCVIHPECPSKTIVAQIACHKTSR
jgi:hypothetical protein